jgi:hypothetical protein
MIGAMMTIALLLTLALAQDDAAAIRALADRMSKDGLTGRLAEAAATDAGVQAIQEKIEFLLAARIARFERDTTGHFEDYLFTADEKGDLRLRPERQPEIDALVKRLPLAARAMTGFSRRADDLVRRLGDGPLEKKAKSYWSDPGFRTAFFHRHPAELRELDDDELILAVGFRGLEGRRIGGPFAEELRNRIAGTTQAIEEAKKYEKSYLKLVAKVTDGPTREALAADTSALFLIGRVLRQVQEGAAAPIGSLTEGDEEQKLDPKIDFTVEPADLLAEVKEGEKMLAAVAAGLDRIAAATDDEELQAFLKNGRARWLLAERILDLQQDQRRKGGEIMNALLEDEFTVDGETLRAKEGRFESVDALAAELEGIIAEFNGTSRQDFDRIAERCLDPGVIALFEDRAGTYLLQEFRDRVVAVLADQVRRQGIEVFIKTYLTKEGDMYVVRPERAARVEAILKRAADIASGK